MVIIVGVIFLASSKDALALNGLFFFVVLRWVGIFGFTPCLGHSFLSKFPQMTPNIVTEVTGWKLVD